LDKIGPIVVKPTENCPTFEKGWKTQIDRNIDKGSYT